MSLPALCIQQSRFETGLSNERANDLALSVVNDFTTWFAVKNAGLVDFPHIERLRHAMNAVRAYVIAEAWAGRLDTLRLKGLAAATRFKPGDIAQAAEYLLDRVNEDVSK